MKFKAVSGDIIGLKKDGTVMSNVYEERTNEELSGWNDIVDINLVFLSSVLNQMEACLRLTMKRIGR